MNQVTVMLKPPAAGADIHILQVLAAGLPDFFSKLTVRTNSVQGRAASLIFTADEGVVTDAQMVRLIECVNGIRAPFQLVPTGVETIREATMTRAASKPAPAPAPAPEPEPEPPTEEAPAESEASDSYSDMKKDDLIELAKSRGVAMYGNKDDIIGRLRAADASGGDVEVSSDDVTIEE